VNWLHFFEELGTLCGMTGGSVGFFALLELSKRAEQQERSDRFEALKVRSLSPEEAVGQVLVFYMTSFSPKYCISQGSLFLQQLRELGFEVRSVGSEKPS